MKKLLLLLSFSILYALPSWAQGTYVNGGITAVDTSATCSTTNGFVVINVSPNSSSVAFNVSGTFSGTLQFVGTVDGARWDAVNAFPPNSTTAATSTTSGGTWKADVANFAQFCVRASAFASGTATVGMRNGSGVSTSTLGSGGGGGGTVTSVSGTTNQIDVATGTTTPVISLDAAIQLPGTMSSATAGAASTPAMLFTGLPANTTSSTCTNGTDCTPQVYIHFGSNVPTVYNTAGTGLGISAPSTFNGDLFNLLFNSSSVFKINNAGTLTSTAGATFSGQMTVGTKYVLNTFCKANGTAASPSVASCGANSSGMFSCATNASGATCVVNTTAVSANSTITITQNAADGGASQLNVTCNTANDLPATAPILAAKSAGTSFTINLGTVSTNPACFEYLIVN